MMEIDAGQCSTLLPSSMHAQRKEGMIRSIWCQQFPSINKIMAFSSPFFFLPLKDPGGQFKEKKGSSICLLFSTLKTTHGKDEGGKNFATARESFDLNHSLRNFSVSFRKESIIIFSRVMFKVHIGLDLRKERSIRNGNKLQHQKLLAKHLDGGGEKGKVLMK